jgi:hypothetical protein
MEQHPPPPLPQVLGLFQEEWDEGGTAFGWRPVAWGLRMPDGSAVTLPVDSPMGVSLWLTVEDAATALDAFVAVITPRHVSNVGRTEWTQ